MSPKGYVNKSLIKVSALEACTVVSKQQINLSTSCRATSPPLITVVLPYSRRRRSRCALKEKEKIDRYLQKLSRVNKHFDVRSRVQAASTSTAICFNRRFLKTPSFRRWEGGPSLSVLGLSWRVIGVRLLQPFRVCIHESPYFLMLKEV